MNGFIKIHRKLLDWEWFNDSSTLHVFLYMLLRANWKESPWKGESLQPGQLITSVKSICEATGLTTRTARTCINRLISTSEIAIKTTNKYTLVTIENWSYYQSEEDEATNTMTSDSTNKRQTNDKQTTTDEEDKKTNKEKKTKNAFMDYQAVVDLWNETVKDLMPVTRLSDGRKKAIRARHADGGMALIKQVFEKVSDSDFLRGKTGNPWQANFDWVMKANNWTKVIDGNYDNKEQASAGRRILDL